MKIFKILVITGIIMVALVAVIGLVMPNTFVIQRSQHIQCTSVEAHALLSDLQEWQTWEPWKESDPSVVVLCAVLCAELIISRSLSLSLSLFSRYGD